MKKFVVMTQGMENYGAHCEDGKFETGNAYWKFKCGSDYIVEGLEREQDAMAFVASIGMENTIGWKEFPSEVMTFDKFCEDFDMDDAFEKEHFDFKMKSMKVVNPITYVKGSL
jgi:hypothetical protein|tara:strand:- start:152 stop:490 length:339 start_codon:yes stop_codon:yes gene_type:complete